MSKIIVAPSILSGNFANLENDIEKLKNAGADWIHVDVMDGHFVPNLTIGPQVVSALRKTTDLTLDVHLMITNPEKYIDDFFRAGSDIITFHYEAAKDNSVELIEKIKSKGVKAGISIKPNTQPNEIKHLLDKLDLVLIMTVEPGFGGQTFMPEAAKKIEYIRQNSPEYLIIEIDGGINKETAKICKKYGANALVAGNYIYKSDNFKDAIDSLR